MRIAFLFVLQEHTSEESGSLTRTTPNQTQFYDGMDPLLYKRVPSVDVSPSRAMLTERGCVKRIAEACGPSPAVGGSMFAIASTSAYSICA